MTRSPLTIWVARYLYECRDGGTGSGTSHTTTSVMSPLRATVLERKVKMAFAMMANMPSIPPDVNYAIRDLVTVFRRVVGPAGVAKVSRISAVGGLTTCRLRTESYGFSAGVTNLAATGQGRQKNSTGIVLDGTVPAALPDRVVAGQRNRLHHRRCGGIGLPTIGHSKIWAMTRPVPTAAGPSRSLTQSIDPHAPDHAPTWGQPVTAVRRPGVSLTILSSSTWRSTSPLARTMVGL